MIFYFLQKTEFVKNGIKLQTTNFGSSAADTHDKPEKQFWDPHNLPETEK